MFLMSRKIKSLGVKMVLSGEGSDEIFGGYLYFHKAPNKEEFHSETCRKVCSKPRNPLSNYSKIFHSVCELIYLMWLVNSILCYFFTQMTLLIAIS